MAPKNWLTTNVLNARSATNLQLYTNTRLLCADIDKDIANNNVYHDIHATIIGVLDKWMHKNKIYIKIIPYFNTLQRELNHAADLGLASALTGLSLTLCTLQIYLLT